MMYTRMFAFCAITMILVSCKSDKYKPADGLRMLSNTEIMQKAEDKTMFNIIDAVFKNEEGAVISMDSVGRLPDLDSWVTDRYVNEENEIKELILRKGTEEEIAFQKELIAAFQKKAPIVLIDIDCSTLQPLLHEVYDTDQAVRAEGAAYYGTVDDANLVTVVSVIEQCGMPTLELVDQKALSAIWLVLQHADNDNRKKYFPTLKKSAANGDLDKSQMALMEDRILMMDGKPQIYGSQISQDQASGAWILYDLEDPERVNARRTSVGLGPLDEYVSNWDISFDVEQIDGSK